MTLLIICIDFIVSIIIDIFLMIASDFLNFIVLQGQMYLSNDMSTVNGNSNNMNNNLSMNMHLNTGGPMQHQQKPQQSYSKSFYPPHNNLNQNLLQQHQPLQQQTVPQIYHPPINQNLSQNQTPLLTGTDTLGVSQYPLLPQLGNNNNPGNLYNNRLNSSQQYQVRGLQYYDKKLH